MNIAIIGGGFTGLTAAYELAKSGHKVYIYEKNTELGGLASGFLMHGEPLEKTYHHIFTTDTDIIDLVKELGLEEKLEWRNSSVCIYYDNKIYPFSGPVDLIKFSPLSFVSRIRLGLVLLFLQKYNNWQKLQNTSAYEWMKKYCGEQVMRVIWEPLLKGKFDRFYSQVSMAWLWARLHIRANSRKLGEGEKLGYFNGGFHVIVDALQQKLSNLGANIFLGANIKGLAKNDGLIKVIETNDQVREYDKVICTVPSYIFADLIAGNVGISSEYLNKLRSINYLGAICVVFSSKQKLSDYYWHNINDLNSPFLAFINHTQIAPKERYGGHYIYYIGAYLPHDDEQFSLEDHDLVEKWFNYLQIIFPEFEREKVMEIHVFRLKNAQHIVDLEYSDKIPDIETPLDGVYLSNFSQIFPEDRGTNYAVREGKKVAKLILEG
ncbi:MAG: oxidoreductase [Candidatus Dojkabacteria bacterium]|nr:MAG: oxidoreductase [Candidatus Dojkabacteria bacterium]